MRRGGEGQVLGTGGPGGLCSSGFSCAALPRAAKSLPPRSLSSRSRGRIKPACCGLAGSPLGGVWHPAPPPGPGGPGRAPLGSPPWCWGGDGRGHPGGRGQGSVHPGHRPPEALGTFPHGLTHGYRATPASLRRDATSLLREPPTLSGRSAALWVPPPPPSSACGPRWGVPPLRPFPVSSGAAASCFPRRSHLLSVPPSILHLVLWSPRRAQRPLRRTEPRPQTAHGARWLVGTLARTSPRRAGVRRAAAERASAREDGPRQVRLRRVRPASPPWSVQRWGPPSASSRGRGTARSLWTATGWGPRRSLDEPSGTPRIGGEVLKAPLTRCPSSSLMCPALERPPRPEGMALGLLVPAPASLRVPSAQSAGRDDPAPAMWSRRGTSAPQRAVGVARWLPAGQPTPGRPGAKLTRLGPPAVGRPDRWSSPQGPEPQRAAGVPCCREQAGPATGAVSASAGSAAPAPGLPQSLENHSHVPSDPGAGPSSHRPH